MKRVGAGETEVGQIHADGEQPGGETRAAGAFVEQPGQADGPRVGAWMPAPFGGGLHVSAAYRVATAERGLFDAPHVRTEQRGVGLGFANEPGDTIGFAACSPLF